MGRVLFDGAWRSVADAVEILNHPGHSSQKSHGRKGQSVADLPRGAVPTVKAAAQGTNPGYGSTLEGPTYRDAGREGQRWTADMGPPPSGAFEENCTNAVMAFEMRMRGYDVRAAPLDVLDKYGYAAGRTYAGSDGGQIDALVASAWQSPGGKAHGRSFSGQKWRAFKEIDAEIARDWPDGGRGFMSVGAHVFSVVKRGGKATYVESQFDASPTRVVTTEYKKKFKGSTSFRTGAVEEAKVIRLDDLEPTDGIFESVEVAG